MVVVSRKNYDKNSPRYMAHGTSYWNKIFSTQISLELLVLGYDAGEQRLQQEVHHGHYSTADSSGRPFAFGSWRSPAPGGRHAYRWPHPAPPCPWALMRAWGRSLGAGHSGRASCAL